MVRADAASARSAADAVMQALAVETSAAAHDCSPTLYAGLRLLQVGVKEAGPLQPSAAVGASVSASSRKAQTPDVTASGARAASAELERALLELEQLRERLHRAEVAEAVQAAKVIEIASSAQTARAATTIQAAFHGHVARAWVRGLREAYDEEVAAATAIQASFHGASARRLSHTLIDAEAAQQRAAICIQAAHHGSVARAYCRGLSSSGGSL